MSFLWRVTEEFGHLGAVQSRWYCALKGASLSGLASWTPHSELFLGGSHWEVTEWIDYTSWLLGRDGGVGEGERGLWLALISSSWWFYPENRVTILLYLKSYRDFLNIKYADVVILKFGTDLLWVSLFETVPMTGKKRNAISLSLFNTFTFVLFQHEWPLWAATMALVQPLPVSAEPHTPSLSGGARRRHPSAPSPPINAPLATLDPMGSVGSLITTHPGPYQDHRPIVELGARVRRPTPGVSRVDSESPQQDLLLQSIPPVKKQNSTTSSRGLEKETGNGNYTYLNEDYIGDWNDSHVTPGSPGSEVDEIKEGLNGNIGGPPPKLIPVSGKLEKVSVWGSTVHTIYVVHIIQFCPPYKDSISQKQGLCHIKHILTTYSQLCLGLILLCKALDYIKFTLFTFY